MHHKLIIRKYFNTSGILGVDVCFSTNCLQPVLAAKANEVFVDFMFKNIEFGSELRRVVTAEFMKVLLPKVLNDN